MPKKTFLLASLIFLVFGLCMHANAAIINYVPWEDPIEVSRNESFQVDIYAEESTPDGDLTSFGFYVDPLSSLTLVSFDGYAITNPDYDDFGMGNFVDGFKNSLEPNAGDIILLASLFFTAGDVNGVDTIVLEGLAIDFNGLAYELGDADISASINVNVVPIPGAVWLLFSGIIGIAGLRKFSAKL